MFRLKPKIKSETGISATDGIGRSASIVSVAERSSGRDRPSSAPIEMPAAAAMPSASAAAPKVSEVCCSRLPSRSVCQPATSHRLGREKPSSDNTPARDSPSHSAARAAGTTTPSPRDMLVKVPGA
jgi:hypothetical protein